MSFRVIQWNIHLNSLAEETKEFLAAKIGTDQTLICLEEVTLRRYRYLDTSLRPTSFALTRMSRNTAAWTLNAWSSLQSPTRERSRRRL
jgi:hypothetical protein